jgi:hypothetical protein
MWIFEGILYVILLLVFIRYDRKKRLWIKTVSQEEKFEHYLSELSATYGKQKNIEEAVAEVEESHTVTLPTEHSYVRIYGAMCAVIREDGDMLSDGYSVFQRNLQYLKEEIRENLLLCKSKMHGFTGLDVLSALPYSSSKNIRVRLQGLKTLPPQAVPRKTPVHHRFSVPVHPGSPVLIFEVI